MLVEEFLFAVILLGFGLGVFAIVAEFLSWRSSQVATLKATVGKFKTPNARPQVAL
jgi:hypothetical protein